MKPTDEQTQAIKLFLTGQSLKINAYAGTGKTSTLVMLSTADRRKGLYLAFNRAIVDEAKEKFSSDTSCMTIHSLALRSLSRKLRKKAFNSTNAATLAGVLELKDQVFSGKVKLTARTLAFLILQTIRQFCQGTEDDIKAIDLGQYGKLSGLSSEDEMDVNLQVSTYAEVVWKRMVDPDDSDIKLGHDGYLKLWALSKPTLNYDYILLDEAQDTNPVVLGVLQHQKCQIVYVGDAFQQIYEWRGAVNAMELFETPNSIYLTKSFRFGKTIADAASVVLKFLGAEQPMRGNPELSSSIGRCEPEAILSRTNSTVMSEVIAAINDGIRCHIIGGPKELLRLLDGVSDLKNGRPSDVPEFFGFTSWDDVEQMVDDGEADNLLTLVNLVRTHGERHLMWALRRTEREEEEADLVISTAFKAKGREWDRVRLAEDLLPSSGEIEGTTTIEHSEARVFYVALTRGRQVVDVDPMKIEIFRSAKSTIDNDSLTQRTTRIRQTSTMPPPSNQSVYTVQPSQPVPSTQPDPQVQSTGSTQRTSSKQKTRTKKYAGSKKDTKEQAIEDILNDLGL